MATEPPADSRQRESLAQSIITLAGTPADASNINTQLNTIARLAADTLTAVSYASVTAVRDGDFTTVAASSDLVVAVDEAQYADGNGPCLEAMRRGVPIAVSGISTTMRWPGFRRAAVGMGLRAALSIPLFDGSGATAAVLNLFGHDPSAMTVLHRHVEAVHNLDHTVATVADDPSLGPDGEQLITGIAEAFAVLSTIQQGIGIVMARERCSAETAYLVLRDRAAETGSSLIDITAAVRDAHHPSTGSDT